MSEKPPAFTVTDHRKFTLEGNLREENGPDATTSKEASEPKSIPTPPTTSNEAVPRLGPRLVTTPPAQESEPVGSATPSTESQPEDSAATPPEVSAQEEAAAHHAYQRSAEHIDTVLRATNPGAEAPPAVSFDHVVQSIYLSAIVALGAAAEPGQQPRIDILGARQSIDMLGVLQEKTKGNLSEKERKLLQSALFEARMMFLDVTNAIAQQAARPPKGKK